MSTRLATTATPIHPPIAARWSPRAFSEEALDLKDVTGLLEAARWAPSCFGAEPWRFVLGIRGRGDGHAAIADCLVPANRLWAERAPVLMITVARTHFEHNDKPNGWAQHDVGLAMGQLGIEAETRGLILHQMGGFDPKAAIERLGIPEGFTPVAAVAIGRPGSVSELPAEIAERESAPRARKPLAEIAFEGRFGHSYGS